MKNAARFSMIALTLCLAVPAMVAADDTVDVTGDWSLTWQGRQGPRTMDMKLAQESGALTGTIVGPQGNEMPLTGTIEGAKIEFTVKFTTERGEFEITYKGDVEGDAMKGKAEVRGNEMEWSAVRK
jgi:hypothetical protein